MYAFFVSIYYSLFIGSWVNFNQSPNVTTLNTFTREFAKNITTFLLNLFGGNFDTLQTFDLFENSLFTGNTATSVFIGFAVILSFVTILIICFAVFGIVKKIFSIFFCGVR